MIHLFPLQNVPFILSLITACLPHTQPVSTGISRHRCHAQGHHKREIYIHYLRLFQPIFRYSMLCFFTTHCSLRLIVRSELDVPTFATRRLHTCHHATAPSGGRWNCVREMSGKFCLNADFHVTFRGSFTCRKATTWDRWLYFPSLGGRAEDFSALKIQV